MRKCKKCNVELDLSLFHNNKTCKDNVSNICKICKKAYDNNLNKQRATVKEHKIKTVKERFLIKYKEKLAITCRKCGESNIKCLTLCCYNKNTVKATETAYETGDYETLLSNLNVFDTICLNCCKKNNLSYINLGI